MWRVNIRSMAVPLIRRRGKLRLANQLRADVVLWSDGVAEKLGCLWMIKVSYKRRGNNGCKTALGWFTLRVSPVRIDPPPR